MKKQDERAQFSTELSMGPAPERLVNEGNMSGEARPPRPSCLVLVPAHNEAKTIGAVVRDVLPHARLVVVVDDGSQDNTSQEAKAAGARVIRHPINLGQGAALQTGFDYALTQDIDAIVTFDADGQMRWEDIAPMLAALAQGAEVALGSRFLGRIEGAPLRRRLFLRLAVRVSNLLSGLELSDAHCGLRALSRQALGRIRLEQPGMAHASELLRQIRRLRLRHVEVPVTIRYTAYSMAKGQSPLHAFKVLWDLFIRR